MTEMVKHHSVFGIKTMVFFNSIFMNCQKLVLGKMERPRAYSGAVRSIVVSSKHPGDEVRLRDRLWASPGEPEAINIGPAGHKDNSFSYTCIFPVLIAYYNNYTIIIICGINLRLIEWKVWFDSLLNNYI